MTEALALESLAPPAPGELLVVVGPTASGKTELAIALAERFGGEVIGADSVQVYRRFDIGSGKPSAAERARAVHHLIDIADAREPLDAARFAAMACAVITDVHARGRVAVLCGGTFLWVRAVLYGLADAAPSSAELRMHHAELAAREGRSAVHERLRAVDPISAARLSPNDFVRVSRALEVYELTGTCLSALHASHGFRAPRFAFRMLGVARERSELVARAEGRTSAWLNAGWADEVRALLDDGYGDTRPMGSVGYRQVADYVRGSLPRDAVASAIDRATRIFMRRQRTWLRDEPVQFVAPLHSHCTERGEREPH